MQGTRVNRSNHPTALRESSHHNRRATGQGYVINTDLQPVDEASYRKETGKSGRSKKIVNKINTSIGITLIDGVSNNNERDLTPNSQLFVVQGQYDGKGGASKL